MPAERKAGTHADHRIWRGCLFSPGNSRMEVRLHAVGTHEPVHPVHAVHGRRRKTYAQSNVIDPPHSVVSCFRYIRSSMGRLLCFWQNGTIHTMRKSSASQTCAPTSTSLLQPNATHLSGNARPVPLSQCASHVFGRVEHLHLRLDVLAMLYTAWGILVAPSC
ncbi:MAG: hypothetical protein ACYC0F_10205 [Rhodanobacter sp.]